VVASVYLLYELVRGLVAGSRPEAIAHADDLVRLERSLGVFVEEWVQRQSTRYAAVATLLALLYPVLHLGVTSAALVWFHRHRPEVYVLLRTAVVVSSIVALVVFALYPVAPPRLAEASMVDTINTSAHAYTLLQPSAITNEYAAMPSLHFGWDLLIGIAIVQAAPPRLRWLGAVPPALMLAAVVTTGNHYLLDAFAGAAISLFGLAVAYGARSIPVDHAAATASREIGRARDAFMSML
jgi:hypothetical protein